MRAMDLGAELGAKIFVLWGGREGTETDACRRADEAVKRLREPLIFFAIQHRAGYKYRLRLNRTNEPRATSIWPPPVTTSASSHARPSGMVGVNPKSRTNRWLA